MREAAAREQTALCQEAFDRRQSAEYDGQGRAAPAPPTCRAALAYHGRSEHGHNLTRAVHRLLHVSGHGGLVAWSLLRHYPALLVAYAAGMAALAAEPYDNLAALLSRPETTELDHLQRMPAIYCLNADAVFVDGTAKMLPHPDAERLYTPASEYLQVQLRSVFQDYVSDDGDYKALFETFEYLLALGVRDIRGCWGSGRRLARASNAAAGTRAAPDRRVPAGGRAG